MYQLIESDSKEVLFSNEDRKAVVKEMTRLFDETYSPDSETIDYESCDTVEGVATDSNGERWMEIKKLHTLKNPALVYELLDYIFSEDFDYEFIVKKAEQVKKDLDSQNKL